MSTTSIREDDVAWGATGLVPAVVQDVADGRVLMVAYVDAEALAATLATGEVHFHSRSRDRLWRKGETSGNVLRLVDMALDCDGDAILFRADPVGPTCHRGTRSCFDPVDGRTAATHHDRRRGRRSRPHGFAGLRVARDAVGHHRGPLDGGSGGVVHGPARCQGRVRPVSEGRRRGRRSSDGRQGRRRGRGIGSGRPAGHDRRA